MASVGQLKRNIRKQQKHINTLRQNRSDSVANISDKLASPIGLLASATSGFVIGMFLFKKRKPKTLLQKKLTSSKDFLSRFTKEKKSEQVLEWMSFLPMVASLAGVVLKAFTSSKTK